MAAEEAASLAGVFSNKTVLDFIGIAIVAPVIASIIAVITARMGITGRIRRLELAEKRIEVITSLLSKSDVDDDVRAQLRAQMRDITAELISDYGNGSSGAFEPTAPSGGAAPRRTAPTAWAELPRWRRWVFPPFTKSILSWVCGIFYYYLLTSLSMFLLGFSIVMLDGSGTSEDVSIAVWAVPFMYLFLHLLRLGMRRAFNEQYAGQVEQRRVAAHGLSPQPAE